jgi:hypothetical protein
MTTDEEIEAYAARLAADQRLSKFMAAAMHLDTGDQVFHKPSGETWLVKRVHNDGYFEWCGWPPGRALVSTVRLVYKATPAEKEKLLREIIRAA